MSGLRAGPPVSRRPPPFPNEFLPSHDEFTVHPDTGAENPPFLPSTVEVAFLLLPEVQHDRPLFNIAQLESGFQ